MRVVLALVEGLGVVGGWGVRRWAGFGGEDVRRVGNLDVCDCRFEVF